MKRVHLIITGDVQGVGYRAWARREAEKLGLTGWVKNRSDGTVEAVAEGKKEILEQFIIRSKQGPEVSWVETITQEWNEATGEFNNFRVVY